MWWIKNKIDKDDVSEKQKDIKENEMEDPSKPKTKERTKRPDVALRLKNRKNIEEKTVCCSLLKRLGCGLSAECSLLLREEIDAWVLSISQITHRLSIMFNRLLLYLLNRKMVLPDFNDAFFNGIALHGMKKIRRSSKEEFSSLIDDFFDNEFNVDYNQFPSIERQRGDCQAIHIASSRYKTNFKNSIHTPFFVRQKKYIRVWCDVNHIVLDKKDIRNIQNRINGWTPLINQTQESEEDIRILDFILSERQLFTQIISIKNGF